MATVNTPQPPVITIFTLPKELRDVIYGYVLTFDTDVQVSTKHYDLDNPSIILTPHPALLNVCKQIRQEATSTYYASNTFSMNVTDDEM